MITKDGYSKDKGLRPEAIVVTFGVDMMNEQGGAHLFLKRFLLWMECHEEGDYWMHKCTNLPTVDVDVVYLSVLGRLWGKVFCGGYKSGSKLITGYTAEGFSKVIDWNHIVLSGPFEHAPVRRKLKGFQGFRYATKLW